MFKRDLKNAEKPEIKLPTSTGSFKKQESSRKKKNSLSALLTMPKPLTVWIRIKCGKYFRRWDLRNLYAGQEATVRTVYGIVDWFQKEKEYIKAAYCHPAYLTYMQSASCEMPYWMKYKLGSRLLGEISITSDMQMTPHIWQKGNN